MSETFNPVKTFEISVNRRLPCWCQKFWTRCSPLPANRDPNTTSARPPSMGREEPAVFRGVVLEIRILDDEEVAPRGGERRPQGPALAEVLGVTNHAHAAAAVPGVELLPGAVGRAVVDDDDLLLRAFGGHETEDLVDRARLVVDGHQDGQLHGLGE